MIDAADLRNMLVVSGDEHLAALDEHLTDDQLIRLTQLVMSTDYAELEPEIE